MEGAATFHARSDHDGDLEYAIHIHSLLTNITLYWLTGAINSRCGRITQCGTSRGPFRWRVRARPPPTRPSRARSGTPPRSFAERAFNIHRWTEMPRGGHFAALEAPEVLAADVTVFFRPLRRR